MKRFIVLVAALALFMSVTGTALAQPANDDLAAATTVEALPFSEVVDTFDATAETGEPVDGDEFCPPRGATVWYALTLPAGQMVTVDTAGSDYDTTLAVYTGTDYTDLSLVACNDDTFFGLQASLTFDAESGVTYLIQAGSFGGGPGGNLSITIDEAGKITGKPVIFKSHFRGSSAEAFVDEFDEETGSFTSSSAFLIDGQSQEGGKPAKFSSLFLSTFSETFDEESGTFTFTEWFGSAELASDQFAVDKKLRSAWVLADVVLEGQTCTGGFEEESEPVCTPLGPAVVTADIVWDGVGGVGMDQFKQKSTLDGVRFMSRGKFSFRNADVIGGWTGEASADLSGGFGSISNQTSGDFIMIRS